MDILTRAVDVIMGVLLRTLAFGGMVAVSCWVGYEVMMVDWWLDTTMASIAGAFSSIATLVLIFVAIDQWILRM